MVIIQECKSQNRRSNPKGWETVFEGNVDQALEFYEGLPSICRVENEYQFIDDGTVFSSQEFMFLNIK